MKNNGKLAGFARSQASKPWSDVSVVTDLSEYLAMNGMRLELEQSPPLRTWRAKSKVTVTCQLCAVAGVVGLGAVQGGQRMSCMCGSGKNILTKPWYFERAVAQPFTDRQGKLWYARLHDGTIEPVDWETWLAAALQGDRGKIMLTCAHCKHTSTTSSIGDLRGGKGMSCMCGSGKNILTKPWYFERAVAQPFTDRQGKLWYARLHDGTIEPVDWETWLAAALQGDRGKIMLTCAHCKHTSTTSSIGDLRGGKGMSCMCGSGKNVLATPWYYEKAISNPFTDKTGKLWYARLHDGTIEPVDWETWLAAALQGSQEGKIRLACAHCKHTSTTCSIHNLQGGLGMSCMCGSGKNVLATPWYYEKAINNPFTDKTGKLWYARLHDGTIEPVDWETWLAAALQGDRGKIMLTCAHCKHTSTTSSIGDLRRGRGMSCNCTMSASQRKVLTWLQAQHPELTWEPEIRDCTRSGRALPFDLACRPLALLVEVDGDQHFEIDGHFVRTPEDLTHRVQTDLFKERWALANGFSVVRLYWADVLYDQADWQGYLRNIVTHRNSLSEPAICVPEWATQYVSGLYHESRNLMHGQQNNAI